MRKLIVFNMVSLDGYFTDMNGDMSWAHKSDDEWQKFVEQNARGGGELVFGRITYELMASFWPTPMAMEKAPVVAEQMNKLPKVVFSTTMKKAEWLNTRVVNGNLAGEIRKMKNSPGKDLVIFGSGKLVAQLAAEGLIDEYQIVISPIVLGKGRTLFENIKGAMKLKLAKTRTFGNGSVLLCYEPLAS